MMAAFRRPGFWAFLLFWAVRLAISFSPSASAQSLPGITPAQLPDPGNLFAGLQNTADQIRNQIAGYADTLFFGLVALDIAWTLIQALLGRGELGDLLLELTKKAVVFNLIYWIFVRNGFAIATTIINSLFQAGTSTLNTIDPAAPKDPFTILFTGVGYAAPMIAEAIALGLIPDEVLGNGATNLSTGLIDLEVFGSVLTVGGFAFLAGTLALAIVESYIVLAAGIFVTGFLGSRWTASIGEKYFSYAFSVAVKLFMVYICVGIVNPIGLNFILPYGAIPGVGPLIGGFFACVVAMIAFAAPQFAASIVSGSSNSSFGQFVGVLAGAASASTALTGAISKLGGGARPTLDSATQSKELTTTSNTAETDRLSLVTDVSSNQRSSDVFEERLSGELVGGSDGQGAPAQAEAEAPASPVTTDLAENELRTGTDDATLSSTSAFTEASNVRSLRGASAIATGNGANAIAIGSHRAASLGTARTVPPASAVVALQSTNASTPTALSGGVGEGSRALPAATGIDASSFATARGGERVTIDSTASNVSEIAAVGPTYALGSGSGPTSERQAYDYAPADLQTLGTAELSRTVNGVTIPQMTRGQLEGIASNPRFGSLRGDQQHAVTSALRDHRLKPHRERLEAFREKREAQSDRLDTINALTGVARVIPAQDGGQTGAVSIRTNV